MLKTRFKDAPVVNFISGPHQGEQNEIQRSVSDLIDGLGEVPDSRLAIRIKGLYLKCVQIMKQKMIRKDRTEVPEIFKFYGF